MDANPGTIHGSNLRQVQEHLKRSLAPGSYQEVLARLAPDARIILEGEIRTDTRYPLAAYQGLLEAFRSLSTDEEFRQSARNLVEQEIAQTFPFLKENLGTDTLIEHMFDMWKHDFDRGIPQLLVISGDQIRIRIADFSMNQAHALHLGECLKVYIEKAEAAAYSLDIETSDPHTTEYVYVRQADAGPSAAGL